MNNPASAGRRGFLRSACRHCSAFSGLGLVAGAWAQEPAPIAEDAPLPARFQRPAVETEEGGLWAMMDREETRLRRSPFVIRDPGLNAYLKDIVCRLGGEHCKDVRVFALHTPQFNASMAPNGMMQVWTGMLLRVDNEAQLAAVLGHELGHYLERHQLERLRDLKSKSAAAMILGMFGLPGALASLGVAASAMGFSREQESRADRVGVRLMRQAGYDVAQSAQIWDDLVAELKVRGGEDVATRSVMFATHPAVGERRDELRKLAGSAGGRLGAEELAAVIAPHRLEWLQEEIRRGQFEESLELFNRKLRARPDDAELLYARGEVRRLRDQPDDLPLALDDLQRGGATARPPAELFRSLGLLQRRRSEPAAAAAAFQKYLALAPQAGDAALIRTYLSEVQ